MIGHASVSDLAIWLVPAAFYFFDNIVRLGAGELLLCEGRSLRCEYRFQRIPFDILGKGLYLCPVWRPEAFAIRASWFSGMPASAKRHAQAVFYIGAWKERLSAFRTVSVVAFIYLFTLAPVLTICFGLLVALIVTATVHLVTLTLTFFAFWKILNKVTRRRRDVILHYLELLVCPGYFPNFARRLSLKHVRLPVDGVLFVKSTGVTAISEGVCAVALSRLSELETADDLDAGMRDRIADYRAQLEH